MCGITAVFSRRNNVTDDAMARGTAALHHRGPDGHKHWISPDFRVGLAMSYVFMHDGLGLSS